MPSGLLILDKPSGVTSRAALDIVQRLARPAKVGHAGTLDPLACGVLVAAVGSATRLIQYVQQLPKRYEGTFLLGRQSDTDDVDGEVVELANPPVPSLAEIHQAAAGLVGEISQRPPAFSAVKIAGRRAYELARKGKAVQPAARPVSVYRLEVVRYEYPELVLRIECGSGTYVRALGRDLAAALGTAAVMSQLVRTAIGGFDLAQAVAPNSLTPRDWESRLLPPLGAVEHLERIVLSDDEIARVRRGLTVPDRARGEPPRATPREVAAVNAAGQLVAILVPRGPQALGPACNLLS